MMHRLPSSRWECEGITRGFVWKVIKLLEELLTCCRPVTAALHAIVGKDLDDSKYSENEQDFPDESFGWYCSSQLRCRCVHGIERGVPIRYQFLEHHYSFQRRAQTLRWQYPVSGTIIYVAHLPSLSYRRTLKSVVLNTRPMDHESSCDKDCLSLKSHPQSRQRTGEVRKCMHLYLSRDLVHEWPR